MDGGRVLAAIETVVARTRAKDPLRGENLALLAWPGGEEPRERLGAEGFDLISMSCPLGALAGDAAAGRERETVFLALYFRAERFVQGLLPIAAPRSHLFRVLTSTHAIQTVRMTSPDHELLSDLFAQEAVTCAERRDGWEQVAEALGFAITAAVSPALPEEEPASAEETLAVILSDIAARPESVTLADLAERYSYSQSYLSELIHERCGKTFGELVREQRMERAAMLLRATSLPVAEVARRVGYAGTSNFYRAFREQHGCSPAELRAASRSGK